MTTSPYAPLKAYLAAPFEERPVMLEIKAALETRGVVVTSTWLTPDDNLAMNQLLKLTDKHNQCRMRAIKDLEDIDAADFYVVYKPQDIHKRPTTGGHHFEAGYAYAKGKACVVYGARENVFHYLPRFQLAYDMLDLIELMHI